MAETVDQERADYIAKAVVAKMVENGEIRSSMASFFIPKAVEKALRRDSDIDDEVISAEVHRELRLEYLAAAQEEDPEEAELQQRLDKIKEAGLQKTLAGEPLASMPTLGVLNFNAPPPIRSVTTIGGPGSGGIGPSAPPVASAPAAPSVPGDSAKKTLAFGGYDFRAQQALARAKAEAYWAAHPKSRAADYRKTAKKLVKTAEKYNPAKNDFPGIDTRAAGKKAQGK